MKRKRFKTCIGCPFSTWGGCGLTPRSKPDYRHREIPHASARGTQPPPDWCPLRKGPLVIELRLPEAAA